MSHSVLKAFNGEGWVKAPSSQFAGKQLQLFDHERDSKVKLELETNEVPISSEQIESFKKLLLGQQGQIKRSDIVGLPEVFGSLLAAEQFSPDEISVGYLKNRLAVRILGMWIRERLATLTCFLFDSSDSTIVRLTYRAPVDLYSEFEPEAGRLFESIEFND